MKMLKIILDFLLETFKTFAALIANLQKDDALTFEKKGKNHKITIPKSVAISFIGIIPFIIALVLMK